MQHSNPRSRIELVIPTSIKRRLQARSGRYHVTQAEIVEYALRTVFGSLNELANEYEDDARDDFPEATHIAIAEIADLHVGVHIRGCCELRNGPTL